MLTPVQSFNSAAGQWHERILWLSLNRAIFLIRDKFPGVIDVHSPAALNRHVHVRPSLADRVRIGDLFNLDVPSYNEV